MYSISQQYGHSIVYLSLLWINLDMCWCCTHGVVVPRWSLSLRRFHHQRTDRLPKAARIEQNPTSIYHNLYHYLISSDELLQYCPDYNTPIPSPTAAKPSPTSMESTRITSYPASPSRQSSPFAPALHLQALLAKLDTDQGDTVWTCSVSSSVQSLHPPLHRSA